MTGQPYLLATRRDADRLTGPWREQSCKTKPILSLADYFVATLPAHGNGRGGACTNKANSVRPRLFRPHAAREPGRARSNLYKQSQFAGLSAERPRTDHAKQTQLPVAWFRTG